MPTAFAGFPPESIQFLRSLKRNNRREWFQPRKHLYEQHVKAPMLELVEAINGEMKKLAPEYVTEPKKALFRIYRDTRFREIGPSCGDRMDIWANALPARRRSTGWSAVKLGLVSPFLAPSRPV